ncbi:MAG: MATE family efflux transporter [Bacteroidaceae bacterium]|nr:MATE family efflux transporter [Bacteroidaceae bacterium]
MPETTLNNKRIAKNTLLLYFRMIIIMLVTLYTSREILKILGVEDFGIYNVVGGVVSMFGLITGALSSAVSRFLNIEIGQGNSEKIKLVFSTSVFIHIIIAVIIVFIGEFAGLWFILNELTIPSNRYDAAVWVFHCSIATFAINLISIPYNALIIANENMKIYAFVSFFEVVLKLLAVYTLVIFNIDKLQLYGVLMLFIAFIIRLVYQVYCHRKYPESHLQWRIDKTMVREMFAFSSWNMLGSSSVIMANQGVNILINIFNSPIVNAARGLALQVDSAVTQFSTNFMTALNPQIVKSYGAKDYNHYKNLMTNGSKFSVVLLSILSLPILLETEYILHLWLDTVPKHSVEFVRLILVFSISEAFSNTFTTGLLATGKLKKLMLFVAGVRMLNLPLSFVVLYFFKIPEITVVISIFLSQICLIIRLKLLKQFINIKIVDYYVNTVLKLIIIIMISFVMTDNLVKWFLPECFLRLLISMIIVELLFITCTYWMGCNGEERNMIKKGTIKMKNKFLKRI